MKGCITFTQKKTILSHARDIFGSFLYAKSFLLTKSVGKKHTPLMECSFDDILNEISKLK
jgi:hypothetical protein